MSTLRIILVLSLFGVTFTFAGRDNNGGDENDRDNNGDPVAMTTTLATSTIYDYAYDPSISTSDIVDEDDSDDSDDNSDEDDDDCDDSSPRRRDRGRGGRKSKCNRDEDMDEDVSSTILPDELMTSTEDTTTTSDDGKDGGKPTPTDDSDDSVDEDASSTIIPDDGLTSSTSSRGKDDGDIFSTVISNTSDPCQDSVNARPCSCFPIEDCLALRNDTGRCVFRNEQCVAAESAQSGFNIDSLTQSDTTSSTTMIGVFGMIGMVILIILIAIGYYFCKKNKKVENGLESIKSMDEDSDDDINDIEGDGVRTNMSQIPDDSDDQNEEDETNIIKVDIESDDESLQALKY